MTVYSCLVSHVEQDTCNRFGKASELPRDKQTFDNMQLLASKIPDDFPITLALGVGERFLDNILDTASKLEITFPCEMALHYHGERFISNRWQQAENDGEEKELSGYVDDFARIFRNKPGSIVFGHWDITPERARMCKRLGLEVDGSYTPYRNKQEFIARNPFAYEGIIEVPATSDGIHPLNPLTVSWHLAFLKEVVKFARKYRGDILIHVGFHSYDIFDWKKKNGENKFAIVQLAQMVELLRKETQPILLCDTRKLNLGDATIKNKEVRISELRKFILRLRKLFY